MRRRALLAAVGLSTAVSTGGCLDTVFGNDGIHLARFSATNHTADPVEFDLRVDRDGETVHRSSHRVRGMGDGRIHGAVADCDWASTAGEYEVFARADGSDWTSKPLEDVGDGWRDSVDCATALAEFYEDDVWLRVRADCDRHLPSASTGVCSVDRETDE